MRSSVLGLSLVLALCLVVGFLYANQAIASGDHHRGEPPGAPPAPPHAPPPAPPPAPPRAFAPPPPPPQVAAGLTQTVLGPATALSLPSGEKVVFKGGQTVWVNDEEQVLEGIPRDNCRVDLGVREGRGRWWRIRVVHKGGEGFKLDENGKVKEFVPAEPTRVPLFPLSEGKWIMAAPDAKVVVRTSGDKEYVSGLTLGEKTKLPTSVPGLSGTKVVVQEYEKGTQVGLDENGVVVGSSPPPPPEKW